MGHPVVIHSRTAFEWLHKVYTLKKKHCPNPTQLPLQYHEYEASSVCDVIMKNVIVSFFNFTLVECQPGSSGLNCIRCPIGQYQPRSGQLSCLQCPYNGTTKRNGTVHKTDCIETSNL